MGKSTWLKDTFPAARVVNLLKESVYQQLLADPSHFRLLVGDVPAGGMVVVDEIQRLPNLLNEIHDLIEERQIIFALSGSSARKLRRAGVNLLGGRAVRREMYPLTREELGTDFQLDSVLTSGSLPLIWQSGGDREVLEAYVQTYLKEEIQAEAIVRNLPGFHRFLPIAALFNAHVINISAIARDAGVQRTTVAGYLDILDDTLLTFRLLPFEGKLRVKEKKHPKLYWVDCGIVRAIKKSFGPITPEERGHLFEAWIAATLRAYQSYRKAFDDWNYWAPTEKSDIEVDFILWRGDECVAIEVKSSRNFKSEFVRGLKIFRDESKLKVRRSIVVYLGSDKLTTPDGFEILPVDTFLTEVEQGILFHP